MAWQDTAVPILRTLLNDAGCGEKTYSESRLEELCIASAHFNVQELPFSTDYTISIPDATITPDPESDVEFINFMVLRAACIADQGTFRERALLAGLEARCGPAILKTMQHVGGFQTLLTEGPCKAFEELKQDYIFGNTDIIRAVLSPFVGNEFQPNIGYNHRDEYR
jgi:hypothetical protein